MSKWTRFMDMHSGGGKKEKWQYIYIEAPIEEAKLIFYNRFGHNPERVTCTCCGEDYSISEENDIEQLSGYDRGCEYSRKGKKYLEKQDPTRSYSEYATVEQYKKHKEVLFINAKQIKASELKGVLPQQGYCWVD